MPGHKSNPCISVVIGWNLIGLPANGAKAFHARISMAVSTEHQLMVPLKLFLACVPVKALQTSQGRCASSTFKLKKNYSKEREDIFVNVCVCVHMLKQYIPTNPIVLPSTKRPLSDPMEQMLRLVYE